MPEQRVSGLPVARVLSGPGRRLMGAILVGGLLVAALSRSGPLLPAPRSNPGAVTETGAARSASGPAATVDVVGDSLVTQAAVDLRDLLVAGGYDATIAERPRQDLGSDFVRHELDAVRSRRAADVLVVATAANDALRDDDRTRSAGEAAAADSFRSLVDRSLEPFADRCVVMVGAREDIAAIYQPAHARAVNALLREARGRHPNLVVVDWAGISRALPADWFAADQLHFGADASAAVPGSRSARAYAAAIVDGIRQCDRPDPVPAGSSLTG